MTGLHLENFAWGGRFERLVCMALQGVGVGEKVPPPALSTFFFANVCTETCKSHSCSNRFCVE